MKCPHFWGRWDISAVPTRRGSTERNAPTFGVRGIRDKTFAPTPHVLASALKNIAFQGPEDGHVDYRSAGLAGALGYLVHLA